MRADPGTVPPMATVYPDGIPVELHAHRQFVNWKYETREDKPTKVPYCPNSSSRASSTDPATWGTYFQALAKHVSDPDTWGIGFVVTPLDPFVGVDLDHVRDADGTLTPDAARIVSTLDSYTEVTPSGDGVRVWVCGNLPPGARRRGFVEMYESGRYFTLTGQHLSEDTIEDRPDELQAIWQEFVARDTRQPREIPATVEVPLDDRKLLDKARRSKGGAQFRALYDEGALGSGDGTQSSADIALCNLLAFWTARDASRIDRLFRASKLMREKWDKRHAADGRTYGQMTIARAVDDCAEVYDPKAYREAHKRTEVTPDPLESLPAAVPVVSNNIIKSIQTEKGAVEKYNARRIWAVRKALREAVGDWPRRVGSLLFAHDDKEVRFLEKPPTLFAWMGERAELSWRMGMGYDNRSFVTQEQFFFHLCQTATAYDDIAVLPHEPPMHGHYYAWEPLTDYVPTGEYLEGLVHLFGNAETSADAALIKAMFCTPLWGGSLGRRPIFAIIAPDRGCGKSTLAEHVGTLHGGLLEFRAGMRAEEEFVSRILSPSRRHIRVVRYDNIRGSLESALVEGIITAPQISGKQMYVGEAVRPNTLTWVLTGNNLRLNSDFAQRCYIIRLCKPEYSPHWDETIATYIREHGRQIQMDILMTLRRAPATGTRVDRWGEWVHGVLRHCCDNPDAVIAAQEERRNDCNDDMEEALLILEELRTREGEYMERGWTFLGRHAVVSAVTDALNQHKIGTKTALSIVRQHISAGHFGAGKACVILEHKKTGKRGFIVWHDSGDNSTL